MRVRWDDDATEEDVTITWTTTFMPRGSVRHQALVDPDALIGRLNDDPTSVFVQLLREYGTAMTAATIKEKFSSLGLDMEIVDRAWKRVQGKLRTHESVGGSGLRYKWKGDKGKATTGESTASPESVAEFDEESEPHEPLPEVSSEGPGEQADASVQPKPKQSSDAVEVAAEDFPQEVAEEKTNVEPAEASVPLAEAIAIALGDKPAPDLLSYAAKPLTTGYRLGELEDAQIDRLLVSVLDNERPHAVALLAALPRITKVIDASAWAEVPTEAMQTVLVASTAELRERSGGPRATTAAGRLLERVGNLPTTPALLLAFIGLTAAVAADPGKEELAVLERAAHVLHGWLTRMGRERCEEVAPETLARIAVELPLTAQGGRAALLVAVDRLWPERATDEIWWRDVTLTALANSATGILGRVTARADIAEHVIAPLMARELAKVAGRARLTSLLALPHEFVAYLPPEGVANAFRRVAVDDPIVDSWVGALTRTSEVAQLKNEAERARSELQRAHGRVEQAEKDARELTARCERLEKLLRQQHERSVDMRAAQERQLQIDAVRALADLAADVEELSVSGATPEILVERVRALVSDQDLYAIGQAGAESSFDPEAHEPLVGAPQAGESVTVLRPGYRWRSKEDTLLTRALVSLTQP